MAYMNPSQFLAPYFEPASNTAMRILPAALQRKGQIEAREQQERQFQAEQPYRQALAEKAKMDAEQARIANEEAAMLYGAFQGGIGNKDVQGQDPMKVISQNPFLSAIAKKRWGMDLKPTRNIQGNLLYETDYAGNTTTKKIEGAPIPTRSAEQLIEGELRERLGRQPTDAEINALKTERDIEAKKAGRAVITADPMPQQPARPQFAGMTAEKKPIWADPNTQQLLVDGQPYTGDVGAKVTRPPSRPVLKGVVPEGVDGFTPGATVLYDAGDPQTLWADGKPYTGKVGPVSLERPYFTALGSDPLTGKLITLDTRTNTVFEVDTPSGGIAPTRLTEDWKQDLMALGQAKDLVGSLRSAWNALEPGNRARSVQLYGEALVGMNPTAKLYADSRDALLGQLSRSIAAERGVLTNQDIERISKALPKIGANPLRVDDKEEANKKWDMIESFITNAEGRMHARRGMTYQNAGNNGGGKPNPSKQSGKGGSWKDYDPEAGTGNAPNVIRYDAQGNRIQ